MKNKPNLSFGSKRYNTLLCALAISASSFAQSLIIKGHVVDENNEPIIGANIVVKGTTTGTITDFDGNFSLTVPNPTSTFPPQNFPVIQHLQFLHIYCGYYKFSNSTELG